MTRHVRTHAPRKVLVLALLLFGFFLLAAPSASAQTDTSAPEATIEPPPDSTPDSTPEEPTDDGDGNEKLLVALLIGAGLVGIVAIIASLMGRSKTAPAPATAPRQAPAQPSPKRQLLGNIQWLHDQLSLELLTGSAEQAAQRWGTERGRADNMAIQAQQVAAGGGGAIWQQLAGSISALSASLDTAINLRSDDDADPALVREAVAVVNRKRSNMLPLIGTAAQGA
ncbi:MAG: hypothetical protein ACC652_12995 [Acidimicrobiales bacterium]